MKRRDTPEQGSEMPTIKEPTLGQIRMEISLKGALIDGMQRVSEVGPYVSSFPKGDVYRGGIALGFDDYPLAELLQYAKERGLSVVVDPEADKDTREEIENMIRVARFDNTEADLHEPYETESGQWEIEEQ